MKLENQVCTLDQGKKLEELGVNTNSLFCYCRVIGFFKDSVITVLQRDSSIDNLPDISTTFIAPAYMVSELGVMLPTETYTTRKGSYMSEYAQWEYVDDGNELVSGLFDNEAEARAQQLINLIGHGLLKIEEVNNALLNS